MAGVCSKVIVDEQAAMTTTIQGAHKREADFFHRLVHDLGQDPADMRWVMAFWLWLEASDGRRDFIRRAYALPGPLVLRFVDEALACLRCLAGDDGAARTLPRTNAFLAKPIDDVGYFARRRAEVLDGVRFFHNNVSLVVCRGTAATYLPAGRAAPPTTMMLTSPAGRAAASPVKSFQPMVRSPGFPLTITAPAFPAPLMNMNWPGAAAAPAMMPPPAPLPLPPPSLNPTASPWDPLPMMQSTLPEEPEDCRSLFVTFSKGFPIAKEDIIEFFNSWFGPCVETVMMEKVLPRKQPVYGRMVLRSAEMIPVVLDGQPRAKFVIKGKHLWARVYFPSSLAHLRLMLPPVPTD